MEATVIEEKMKSSIMQDIRALPQRSIIVQEAKALLKEIGEPDFWRHLSKTEIDRLLTQVAPVMRAMSGVDFKAMAFEKDVIDYGTARLLADTEMMDLLSLDIMAQVEDLPRNLNQVAAQRKWIERVLDFASWKDLSDDDLDEIMARLGPLMKFRRPRSMTQVLLNIQDLLDVKEYIEFGPENERLTVATYRQKVELAIQRLMLSNPVLQKLQKGTALTPAEIRALADLLGRQDPYVTEDLLQKAYDNKKATFIQFIKHILGLEKLTTFSEMVTSAFDQFIVQHNDYTRQQIQFLLTLKTFILQNEKVTKKDLVHLPFTRLHPLKKQKNILFLDNDKRRRRKVFYPYETNSRNYAIEVQVKESDGESAGAFNIEINGPADRQQEINSWDEIFEIKTRYRSQIKTNNYRWVEGFNRSYKKWRKREANMEFGDFINEIRETLAFDKFQNKAFLQKSFFEYLAADEAFEENLNATIGSY
jgi:type I site-specific restriction endonuclease